MKKFILGLVMTSILAPAAFAVQGHVTCLMPSEDSLTIFTQDKKVVEDAYIFEADTASYNEIDDAKIIQQDDKVLKIAGQLLKKSVSFSMDLQSVQQKNATLTVDGKAEDIQCFYSEMDNKN